MEMIPQEIEEVEIKYRLTGDLNKDAAQFGKTKKIIKLETDVGKYLRQKSSPQLMTPQTGDFVQPVGPGFSIGKVKPQWDDIDLSVHLKNTIPIDFFTKDLNLKPAEISTFIFYILNNFERDDILKYAKLANSDYARFQVEAVNKIESFKNNVPNISKDKKMKLKTKNVVLKHKALK